MPKEKKEKIFFRLEPHFNEILAKKGGEKSPFIETFVFEGENVVQENLGTLCGVLEVTEESEESSYIVNYLISIIKKEYFANPKRGAIESFESALHKANLALSKLAEHGSIRWIGNLNAAIAVIEKNTALFSQTGKTKILLLRSQGLMNLSEEEYPEAPNPLKTFQDVVTGRVEEKDKIILATDSVFSIFSEEEIKKSALRFSEEEFLRFMKTALVNELEKAAVLVIDIEQKEIRQSSPASKKSSDLNAFSQVAFLENKKNVPSEKENSPAIKDEERKKIIKGIKEEYEKSKGDFVDQKTGHIYIKEDSSPQGEENENETTSFKDYGQKIISGGENILSSIKEKTRLKIPQFKEEQTIPETEKRTNIRQEDRPPRDPLLPKIIFFLKISWTKIAAIASSIFSLLSLAAVFLSKKIFLPFAASARVFFLKTFAKRKFFKEKFQEIRTRNKKPEESISQVPRQTDDPGYLSSAPSRQEKRSWFLELSQKRKGAGEDIYDSQNASRPPLGYAPGEKTRSFSFSKFLPDLSKIKSIWNSLGKNGKIAIVFVLILIFIVPYFIAKFTSQDSKAQPEKIMEAPPVEIMPLSEDKNVVRMNTLTDSVSKTGILEILNLNGKFFAAGKYEIISLEDQKEYPLSEDFQNFDLAFGMDDLNLIFILKNGHVTSWSAASGKFQDNNISIPTDAEIVSAKAYLTYAYLLDKSSSQIYRYPRAEGGFGEKTNWIKEDLNLSGATDIAINENVFMVENGKILKFFQGKIQEFETEQSATPIVVDRIYARVGSENLYALDKANSRIVKFDGNGKIVSQYHHPSFGDASGLAADEEKNVIYVASEGGVKSFEVKQ